MEYSENFKNQVKAAYPNDEVIHDMLDKGNLLLELQLMVKHAEYRQLYNECKNMDAVRDIRDKVLARHACLKRFRREYGSLNQDWA